MGMLLLLIVIALGTAELLSLLIIIALMAVLPAPPPLGSMKGLLLCVIVWRPSPTPYSAMALSLLVIHRLCLSHKLTSRRQLQYS